MGNYNLVCKHLILKGQYEVKGSIDAKFMEGKGDFEVDLFDYAFLFTGQYEIQQNTGTNTMHLDINPITLKLEPRGRVVYNFKNIQDDDDKKSSNIKPCHTYDMKCFKKTANHIFSTAVNGDPTMNIESLDPVKQEYIEGNLSIIKYKLFNNTVFGFKNCRVGDANVTLEKNSMSFKMICPYLSMNGIYEMSGLLISIPIEGKGDYSLSTKDYHIFVETETKITKASDGKNYLSFKNFKVDGDLKGELVADLKNLFNGKHKELAEAALKFVHEQSRAVSKLLQGPVFNVNVKKVIKNMNKYLKHVSLDKILII